VHTLDAFLFFQCAGANLGVQLFLLLQCSSHFEDSLIPSVAASCSGLPLPSLLPSPFFFLARASYFVEDDDRSEQCADASSRSFIKIRGAGSVSQVQFQKALRIRSSGDRFVTGRMLSVAPVSRREVIMHPGVGCVCRIFFRHTEFRSGNLSLPKSPRRTVAIAAGFAIVGVMRHAVVDDGT